jgi:hypothetical protein
MAKGVAGGVLGLVGLARLQSGVAAGPGGTCPNGKDSSCPGGANALPTRPASAARSGRSRPSRAPAGAPRDPVPASTSSAVERKPYPRSSAPRFLGRRCRHPVGNRVTAFCEARIATAPGLIVNRRGLPRRRSRSAEGLVAVRANDATPILHPSAEGAADPARWALGRVVAGDRIGEAGAGAAFARGRIG